MVNSTDKDLHYFRFYSEFEHDAAFATSQGIVAGKFRLIEFKSVDKYNQYCFDSDGRLFKVASIANGSSHALSRVLSPDIKTAERISQWELFFPLKNQYYQYDPYYDTLIEPSDIIDRVDSALVDFPVAKDEILLVKGEYTDCRPLLYCLQRRFLKVIVLPKYDIKPINFKDSFMVPLAMNAKIEIMPQASPSDYVDDWSPAIFVPLVESTLSSKFYGNLTWRDILPENPQKDFYMAELPIITVWIRFDFDANGTIFVSSKTANGKEQRIDTNKSSAPQSTDIQIISDPSIIHDMISGDNELKGVPPRAEMVLRQHNNNFESRRFSVKAKKREDGDARIPALPISVSKERADNLEKESTDSLSVLKDSILDMLSAYDYVYSDANVWITTKTRKMKDGTVLLLPLGLFHDSMRKITEIMKDSGGVHCIYGQAYDEIENFRSGVHKYRSLENITDPQKREQKAEAEKIKKIVGEKAFKIIHNYYERSNNGIIRGRKPFFMVPGMSEGNQVSKMENAKDVADENTIIKIKSLYLEGKRVLLITNDGSMRDRMNGTIMSLALDGVEQNPSMPLLSNVTSVDPFEVGNLTWVVHKIEQILKNRLDIHESLTN